MKINKRCLSTFSKTKPYLALGSKSKLFDTTFSLTSELSLYDYNLDIHYPTLQLDRKFSKLIWCEKNDKSILATGHDNGMLSLYEPDLEGNSFKILNSFTGLEGDVLGLDFNISKNVIAAGSSNGKIIFWNLDKIDQQYKCDIPINGNITTLSWNKKVSRILCAGTEDGKILVLDIRSKNIAMTLENPEIKTISNLSWNPNCPTSIFASTNLNCLHSFNLSTDSMSTIGEHKVLGFDILNDKTLIAYSKERINYIDINKQKIQNYEEVEGLFEASFSQRDPLCCLSNSNGFTKISSRRDEIIILRNPQKILNDFVMICNGRKENGSKNLENGFNEGSKKDGSSKNENDSNNDLNSNFKIDNLKIIYPKLIKKNQNDLNHSLMKIIYKSGEFNLTNKNRKEIGNLIYEKCVEEWKERKNGNDDKEGNDSKDEGSEKEGNTPNNLDSNGNEENDTNPNNPNSNQGLNYKVKDFNLNDPVIQNLIKHDFEKIQKGLKSVDLKFILNLLQKKEIESFEDSFNSEIHYLLFLFFTKKYDNLVKDLPPSQWKIIISILLFSDHPLENCLESFKKIKIEKDEDDEKEGDKQILFLLTNNPKEILKTNLIKSEPKSIFEINEFFSEYVPIVEKIKALKIETEDKFLKEFVKYAKDHGIYELLKDLEENEDGNNDVNVNVNKSVENINQDLRNINLNQNIRNVGYSPQPPQNVGYPPKKPGYPQPNQNIISPQNIINPQPNPQNQPHVSHPSKTYSKPPIPKQPHQNYPNQVNPIPSPIERQKGPTIPRVVPSLRQNFKPSTRPDIGSQNIPTPSSGFCTRPPVKSPLYSCPSSGSTPNIPNVNNPNIHNTYGSENNSYLKPKTPPLPNQGIKGIIPKPSLHPKPQPNYNPNPLVVQSNSFYDKIGLSTDLEKIYENLREEASKKNNLIIGNKIKDANRRFSVFLNLDKTSLTNNVLYKMNLLVQTFKDVNDKKLLRQSVKVIIEESIDIQENQCNIWMPSIFTLVQLVY